MTTALLVKARELGGRYCLSNVSAFQQGKCRVQMSVCHWLPGHDGDGGKDGKMMVGMGGLVRTLCIQSAMDTMHKAGKHCKAVH